MGDGRADAEAVALATCAVNEVVGRVSTEGHNVNDGLGRRVPWIEALLEILGAADTTTEGRASTMVGLARDMPAADTTAGDTTVDLAKAGDKATGADCGCCLISKTGAS